jgi:hypothetical protein
VLSPQTSSGSPLVPTVMRRSTRPSGSPWRVRHSTKRGRQRAHGGTNGLHRRVAAGRGRVARGAGLPHAHGPRGALGRGRRGRGRRARSLDFRFERRRSRGRRGVCRGRGGLVPEGRARVGRTCRSLARRGSAAARHEHDEEPSDHTKTDGAGAHPGSDTSRGATFPALTGTKARARRESRRGSTPSSRRSSSERRPFGPRTP